MQDDGYDTARPIGDESGSSGLNGEVYQLVDGCILPDKYAAIHLPLGWTTNAGAGSRIPETLAGRVGGHSWGTEGFRDFGFRDGTSGYRDHIPYDLAEGTQT